MPYTDEQGRKGQILKRRRQAAGMSVRELAEKVGRSTRQIEYIQTGHTWNQGTVDLILKELGLDESVFGDSDDVTTLEDKALADADIWARFPDDVKVQLIILGGWLSSRPVHQRFEDAGALAEFMRARTQPNG